MRRRGASPLLLKTARPGTRDCACQCSAALHTACRRLAQRNRSVDTPLTVYVGPRRYGCFGAPGTARTSLTFGTCLPPMVSAESAEPCTGRLLRRPPPPVSAALPAPTISGPAIAHKHPPPARLSRSKCGAPLLQFDCHCKLPRTVLPRLSRINAVACRGLRPCPLCHLCPATATAIAVAASCPKQHRPADERPLQPRCEVQRHHPREGSCRIYIFIYSLGVVDNCIWKVYSNGDSEYQIFRLLG